MQFQLGLKLSIWVLCTQSCQSVIIQCHCKLCNQYFAQLDWVCWRKLGLEILKFDYSLKKKKQREREYDITQDTNKQKQNWIIKLEVSENKIALLYANRFVYSNLPAVWWIKYAYNETLRANSKIFSANLVMRERDIFRANSEHKNETLLNKISTGNGV